MRNIRSLYAALHVVATSDYGFVAQLTHTTYVKFRVSHRSVDKSN